MCWHRSYKTWGKKLFIRWISTIKKLKKFTTHKKRFFKSHKRTNPVKRMGDYLELITLITHTNWEKGLKKGNFQKKKIRWIKNAKIYDQLVVYVKRLWEKKTEKEKVAESSELSFASFLHVFSTRIPAHHRRRTKPCLFFFHPLHSLPSFGLVC